MAGDVSTITNVNTGFNITGTNNTSATERGTKIVDPSQGGMDQNSFLKILTAELSNQDPDNTQDSTQYVAQMAQFAGLEQMANLNTNLNFSNAAALIGKQVTLNAYDSMGNQYSGIVKGVSKDSSGVQLSVEVNDNGQDTVKNFTYDMISNVDDTEDAQSTANDTQNTQSDMNSIQDLLSTISNTQQ